MFAAAVRAGAGHVSSEGLALDSVGFAVPSADAALALFAGVLGGTPQPPRHDPAEGGAVTHVGFPPGTSVRLVPTGDGGPEVDRGGAGRSGLRDVTLTATEPERWAARLRAAGVPVRPVADGAGVEAVPAELGARLRILAGPTREEASAAAAPGDDGDGALARSLDHVCVAVRDLRAAVAVMCDVLGGAVVFGGRSDRMGTLSAQVRFAAGAKVELLQGVGDASRVTRYVGRYGPGLHHLTFVVRDVRQAVAAAEAAGFPTVDTMLSGPPHWQETYLRPSRAFGALIQLAWTDLSYSQPLAPADVEAILAHRVDSSGYRMRPRTPAAAQRSP